jgi:hypothetical protein
MKLHVDLEGDAEAQASAVRMATILAYVKDPASRPEFADKPRVFKLVTDERTYQQALAQALAKALEDAPTEDREALETKAAAARKRQAMLFGLLKKLTGVSGHTGGTEFEAEFGP